MKVDDDFSILKKDVEITQDLIIAINVSTLQKIECIKGISSRAIK